MLTAFVVETFPMLQEDSMTVTNQLLAAGLAPQTRATITSPSLNNTIVRLLANDPFEATTSARWINTLFFLSLVFSLAAAFLGILAKQWLREYMQWNSPLRPPRDNILIRQIRFEAWKTWNVGATITSIPTLLMIAMLLFIVGAVILLWTVDNVVAIIVTLGASVFIGVAGSLIVLPIIFVQCPYKSPTAWTCFVAADAIRRTSSSLVSASHRIYRTCAKRGLSIESKLRRICDHIRQLHIPDGPKSWRQRDKESILTAAFANAQEVQKAAVWQLAMEAKHLGENDTFVDEPHRDSDFGILNYFSDVKTLLSDISETAPLLRALAWVHRDSQDVKVLDSVDVCARSIHQDPSADRLSAPWSMEHVRILSDWCILASCWGSFEAKPEQALYPSEEACSSITALRRRWGCRALCVDGASEAPRELLFYRDQQHAPQALLPECLTDYAAVFGRVIVADLNYLIDNLAREGCTGVTPRRMLEMLYSLKELLDWGLSDPSVHASYLGVLNHILSEPGIKTKLDAISPGVRSEVFMLACRECDAVVRPHGDGFGMYLFVLAIP